MSVRSRRGPRFADEITSKDFAELKKDKLLAILPVGSLEEHGEHLPLGTDAMQAEEVVRQIASRFESIVLPPLRYGECRTARGFPGTVSLSFETIQSFSFDVITELARNGVFNVLVLTGHAGSGHMAALRLGAQRAVEQNQKLKVMVLSDYDIAYDLRGKEFSENDGHGGDIETSRILNIRPKLVKRSRPKGSWDIPEFMVLPHPEKYIPAGIAGDTSKASPEKGKRIDDYVVDRLCKLISKNFGIRRV